MKRLNLTIRERLCDMLREKGFTLVDTDLLDAKGYWRMQDVYRWSTINVKVEVDEGSGLGGRQVSIDSWDTMTKCVCNGFTLSADTPYSYEAYANKSRIAPIH